MDLKSRCTHLSLRYGWLSLQLELKGHISTDTNISQRRKQAKTVRHGQTQSQKKKAERKWKNRLDSGALKTPGGAPILID